MDFKRFNRKNLMLGMLVFLIGLTLRFSNTLFRITYPDQILKIVDFVGTFLLTVGLFYTIGLILKKLRK